MLGSPCDAFGYRRGYPRPDPCGILSRSGRASCLILSGFDWFGTRPWSRCLTYRTRQNETKRTGETSMNAASVVTLDAPTLAALRAYLSSTGNKFSLSNIASQAIRAWLADHAGPCDDGAPDAGRFDAGHAGGATEAPAAGARGYQWKELFLPEGTELRMQYNGEVYHARVSGDAIMYQARRVSPRQFTIAIAGDGRNAWRDLSLRLPGEQHFRPASQLRRRLKAALEGQQGRRRSRHRLAGGGHRRRRGRDGRGAAQRARAGRTQQRASGAEVRAARRPPSPGSRRDGRSRHVRLIPQ